MKSHFGKVVSHLCIPIIRAGDENALISLNSPMFDNSLLMPSPSIRMVAGYFIVTARRVYLPLDLSADSTREWL
jgi:hypothetical protein